MVRWGDAATALADRGFDAGTDEIFPIPFKEFVKHLKNIDFYFLRIPIAFAIMAGIVYITYHVKYDVWVFLAIADVFEKKYNSNKNENSSC